MCGKASACRPTMQMLKAHVGWIILFNFWIHPMFNFGATNSTGGSRGSMEATASANEGSLLIAIHLQVLSCRCVQKDLVVVVLWWSSNSAITTAAVCIWNFIAGFRQNQCHISQDRHKHLDGFLSGGTSFNLRCMFKLCQNPTILSLSIGCLSKLHPSWYSHILSIHSVYVCMYVCMYIYNTSVINYMYISRSHIHTQIGTIPAYRNLSTTGALSSNRRLLERVLQDSPVMPAGTWPNTLGTDGFLYPK